MLLSLDTMATPKATKAVQSESEACHSSFSLSLNLNLPIRLSPIPLGLLSV